MQLKASEIFLWVGAYFGVLLFCTFLDVALWRRLFPSHSHILALLTEALSFCGFAVLLCQAGFRFRLLENLSLWGILLALACAALFYFTLDQGLDPLLDRLFPQSQQSYEESLTGLRSHPTTGLLRVCLLAPILEESLTRGVILDGMQNKYGWPLALAVSAGIFALLHFNLVQTLSALVCGLVLGALYLYTGSLLCCMLAHAAYNLLSCLILLHSPLT